MQTSETNTTDAGPSTLKPIVAEQTAESSSGSQEITPSIVEQDTISASGSTETNALTTGSTGVPLSKKAQKKAAKQAYFAERKLERRAKEKAAKKEKKRQRRERQDRIAAGEVVSDDDDDGDVQPTRKKARRDGPVKPFNARVVLDLGFDDMMSDKLAYTYNANRNARCPFKSVLFTSLDKRTRKRLDSLSDAAYKRWDRTEWWEQGYDRLWSEEDVNVVALPKGADRSKTEKENVVYLTADASDELEDLKEGETYIIGGICDHNRYKNLCQNKAKEGGIRSARLPIGRYLAEMTSRKVLTVNQVFEILVHWTESRDWEAALYSVVPKRKLEEGKKGRSQSATLTADGDNQKIVVGEADTEETLNGEENTGVAASIEDTGTKA